MDNRRLKATHFAEVWRGKHGYYNCDVIEPIQYLPLNLEMTKSMGGITIAIWKIKFKKP